MQFKIRKQSIYVFLKNQVRLLLFLGAIYSPNSLVEAQQPAISSTYSLVCRIPLDGGSFTTDNLQNIYFYHGNSIKKYTTQGQLLYSYSDKSYGNITTIDVNDPMKILVFYKDFP